MPRRLAARPLTRLIALAAGSSCAALPWLAQASPPGPTLTAQEAHAAIIQVLAVPALTGRLPTLQLLTAITAMATLAALALVMRHLASRRPLGAVYTPLPEHSLGRVIDEAESLWPQAPSEAIGLLFRGLLARLAMDYQLLVSPGATEPELVEQVASLRLSGLEDFTRRLAEHWQQARYAGALPSDAAWAGLCVSWRRLFPTDVAA